jgi:hypothetical protein
MNTYEELEVKIHAFSTLALGGGECSESCSGPFASGIHYIEGSLDSLVGIVINYGKGDPGIVVLFSIWGKTYFSTLQLPDRT